VLRASVTAYLALGANLGDPAAALLTAMDDIAAIKGVSLLKRSSLYRTVPLSASGPDYVNAVVEIQTILSAPELLVALQQIEQLAGRVRSIRNAPRTLDLDLLTYGDASIDSQALVVPHPRLTQRAFVLVPLAEIAPHRVTSSQLAGVERQVIERL
jgi:2-amino-4-hydroxy-6-hydroxymethyldihydropteridine diphosphokinase